jgi:CcdB protein.
MSQYHIYENLNPNSKQAYPYLIDVQTTLLTDLETRIVIPVALKSKFGKGIIKNLNPIITINKKEYVIITQQIAGIPSKQLGSSVYDCLALRQEILSAIDFLITGI